eukprot:TRINITY_DN4525_c0_g2_i2.p1 TRINITY_DN4525_c0_g2~~TRINITY_DN4525_c0_g2_i2.p1  ORF type:complete len:232 (-),score=63.68 TRINITY_DN4525_c0_g2_i2:100-795(-)
MSDFITRTLGPEERWKARVLVGYQDNVLRELMRGEAMSYSKYLEEKLAGVLEKIKRLTTMLLFVSNADLAEDAIRERVGGFSEYERSFLVNLTSQPTLEVKILPFDLPENSLSAKLSLEMMMADYGQRQELRTLFRQETDRQKKLELLTSHLWNIFIATGCVRTRFIVNIEAKEILTSEELDQLLKTVKNDLPKSLSEQLQLDETDREKIVNSIDFVIDNVAPAEYFRTDY